MEEEHDLLKVYKDQLIATPTKIKYAGYINAEAKTIGGINITNFDDFVIKGWNLCYYEQLVCTDTQIKAMKRVANGVCKVLDGHPENYGRKGHDSEMILGTLSNLTSDGKSLRGDIALINDHDDEICRRVNKKLASKTTLPTSIGYTPISGSIIEKDPDNGMTVIRVDEWQLLHIAIVAQGMDENTSIIPK